MAVRSGNDPCFLKPVSAVAEAVPEPECSRQHMLLCCAAALCERQDYTAGPDSREVHGSPKLPFGLS